MTAQSSGSTALWWSTTTASHAATEVAGTTNLAAGMHCADGGLFPGQRQPGPERELGRADFAQQAIPDAALFLAARPTAAVPAGISKHRAGLGGHLQLRPSFMYDEVEGLYKIWMCGAGISGSVGGDNILYREATSLEGLMTAPLTVALQPSLTRPSSTRSMPATQMSIASGTSLPGLRRQHRRQPSWRPRRASAWRSATTAAARFNG